MPDTVLYRNVPRTTIATGGWPTAPSNARIVRGNTDVHQYSAGQSVPTGRLEDTAVRLYGAGRKLVNKLAGVDNEPAAADHPGAPDKQYRPRAEVILFSEDGVYAIDKGDYLLFPGGGIADGEQPRDAALRETLEESGRCALNCYPDRVVEATWPKDTEFQKSSPFVGERSYFFLALDGGDSKLEHPDREAFTVMPFDTVIKRLTQLIADKAQAWARANNETRLQLVEAAQAMTNRPQSLQPVKYAADTTQRIQQFVQQLAAKYRPQAAAPAQPGGAQPAPAPATPPPQPAQAGAPAEERLARPPTINAPLAIQVPKNQALDPNVKLAEDHIPGGVGDGTTPKDFDPEELLNGALHELEHTDDPRIALEIAQDHLAESPTYYSDLDKAEKQGVIKQADAPSVLDKDDFLLFTPDGRLVVQRRPNRRFGFVMNQPAVKTKKAPYEDPIQFFPSFGVPEPGVHGYNIRLNLGESPDVPEGFEAADPDEVLREMYASMGLAVNKPFRHLDRARARAILRELRRRRSFNAPR